MANFLIKGETLTQIADAIRAKTGGTAQIAPGDMSTEIAGIAVGGNLGSLSVTENGTYNPTYEAASFSWDENTEYDGVLSVDDIPLRYKKVASLTVPDSEDAFLNSGYSRTVRYSDGSVDSEPLNPVYDSGVYLQYDRGFEIVWVQDATFVNMAYGASLESNTVYVTDYPWLAHSEEYAGASFTFTAPGKKIDGFSSVTVDVEAESGGGVIDLANIPEVDSLEVTDASPTAVKYDGAIYLLVEGV